MAKLLPIFFLACCFLAALGLVGHLAADAMCQSPDLAALRGCGTVPARSTSEATLSAGLHAGFVVPARMLFAAVLTLIIGAIVLRAICRMTVCPLLLHPPAVLS